VAIGSIWLPKLPLIDIGLFFRIDAAFKPSLIYGECRRILIIDAKPGRDVGAKRSKFGRAARGKLLDPAHASFQSGKFIHCAVDTIFIACRHRPSLLLIS